MKSRLSPALAHRLDSHFLTCSAVVAGVTGFTASQSDAAIIYSGVLNVPIYPTTDPGNGGLFNGGMYFDFELPGVTTQGSRFPTWDVNPYESGTKIYIAPNTRMVATGTTATSLLEGTTIGPASVYNASTDAVITLPVPATGSTYVGFKFTSNNPEGNVGTVPLYGWALISPKGDKSPGTLVSYAFETTGLSIEAGAVPEPSSLSLLALGSLGLTQLRRRRAA